jgi:hypothetical protein
MTTLFSRYDPENDVDPKWPGISFTEHSLLVLISDLVEEVEKLNKEVETLQERVIALNHVVFRTGDDW